MECYKEFASIYDKLINTDINYEEWSKVIMGLCNELEVPRTDYLDLACGTGNMTALLSKKFAATWAVDLSTSMLTEAERKLRKEGIRAKFAAQSISELNLNRKFDLITCCLDSSNYLLEDGEFENFIKSAYEHLKEKGLFIFDVNSYYKLKEILGNNLFTYEEENLTYIWENNFEEDIVDMYLTFFVKEGNFYRKFTEEHSERAYKEEFIDSTVEDIGFKIYKKLDNYKNKEINNITERIVYCLTK